jgi:hypothetical protein
MKVPLLVDASPAEGGAMVRLVHEFDMPPFAVPPGVVIWGGRVFVREDVAPHAIAYVESFAYSLDEGAASIGVRPTTMRRPGPVGEGPRT